MFMGKFSQEKIREVVFDRVRKAYKTNDGIRWKTNNHFFISQNCPIYSQEQLEQIKKYCMIVNGNKKPLGMKRTVTVYSLDSEGFSDKIIIEKEFVLPRGFKQ